MKRMSIKPTKSVLGALTLSASLIAGTAYAAGTLNVYNWDEYIGEETIANFEKNTILRSRTIITTPLKL